MLVTFSIALAATGITGCVAYPHYGYGYGSHSGYRSQPYYGGYRDYGHFEGYGNQGHGRHHGD